MKKRNYNVFEVTVADTTAATHLVTLTDRSLRDLNEKGVTKKQPLEFSFKFLLDREPNTSILESSDITAIDQYCPKYRDEVRLCYKGSKNSIL